MAALRAAEGGGVYFFPNPQGEYFQIFSGQRGIPLTPYSRPLLIITDNTYAAKNIRMNHDDGSANIRNTSSVNLLSNNRKSKLNIMSMCDNRNISCGRLELWNDIRSLLVVHIMRLDAIDMLRCTIFWQMVMFNFLLFNRSRVWKNRCLRQLKTANTSTVVRN